MTAAVGMEWFSLWKPGVAQKRKITEQSQELGKSRKYEVKVVSTI